MANKVNSTKDTLVALLRGLNFSTSFKIREILDFLGIGLGVDLDSNFKYVLLGFFSLESCKDNELLLLW